MDITVVTVIKDRDSNRLVSMIRTVPAGIKVIVVDESDFPILRPTDKHESYRYIHYPLDLFNMPKAFNIAIQECHTPYIMFTGADMLFSPNFFDALTNALVSCDNPFVMAYMGYLPRPMEFMCVEASDPDIWKGLLEEVEDPPTQPLSTGTQAGLTSWFTSIRGFDERFVGLGGPDSDMLGQAQNHGLNIIWIPWEEAQILHQWHEISELKGMSSHLIYETVEERNPGGWGWNS